MKPQRSKNWRFLDTLGLLCQTIGRPIGPTIAFAEEITHPQTVTVELDLAHQYAVEGTFSDGRLMSEVTVPHYAVYSGVKQDIFCIEPGIPIDNQFTPGYER
ncbi:hypothetical protein EA71_01532 [Enterococcus durans]|uniref:Uncharacterized protein n=1 Tax=Enterococcus durans TaxID=53345 RepID=A0A367CDQ2_9ENTE|nr:hypothetical protein [Enterococcus durans]RCA10779.1 hypothetical protein EA71_01532 [Enterococcus durans]